MQFPLIALLALASTAIAKPATNCRNYDVVFVTCVDITKGAAVAQRDSGIRERITSGAKTCIGGDGATYLSRTQFTDMDQKAGPTTVKCAKGWQKYLTKVRIWRWRNKWDWCSNIDSHMPNVVYNTDSTYWYHNPQGPQVSCID